MKTITITRKSTVILIARINDNVQDGEIVSRISSSLDGIGTIVRSGYMVPESLLPIECWDEWLKRLAILCGVSVVDIVGNSKLGAKRTARSLAFAAWMDGTGEGLRSTAERMDRYHGNVATIVNRFNDRGKRDKEVRSLHLQAIELCKEVVKEFT